MYHVRVPVLSLWICVAALPSLASDALPPQATGGLSLEQRQLVNELLASQHPYECCPDTIAACLTHIPVCPLARRLERAIDRMAAAGMSRGQIEEALAQRKQTMSLVGSRAKIELNPSFSAGEPSSPVVLALYACGRHERCAKLVPWMYGQVTSGRLKGKVRLYYRPFFPSDQDDASACARALVAAAEQGMFWPFLNQLYTKRDSFQRCLLRKWADFTGLDRDAFEIAYNHPRTTDLLQAVRREGLENHVDCVPCAFINGHKVEGELSREGLLDLLEEEYDRQMR
jgi:hypothetical protein